MLQGKKIVLKILEKRHLRQLRFLRNQPQTNYYLTSIVPISEAKQQVWFKKISLDETKMYFAIEDYHKKFLGIVRCDEWDKINRSIRVGIDIVPELRRQGIATEAYELLFKYLFRDLGIHRVWLLVADFNQPAYALYQKLGFKLEGKQREALYRDNKFHHYLMMSLLKSEYEKRYCSRS